MIQSRNAARSSLRALGPERLMSKARVLFQAALVGTLAVAVFGSTVALVQKNSDYSFFDPITEVKAHLSRSYVDQIPADKLLKMQTGAITGMLEALDDPYTVYVAPSDTAEFNKDILGEYVGIGAQVNIVDGYLIIVSPLEDSPALRAGLLPQDKVVEIEGSSTHNLSVDQCISKLMGEAGTKVNLTIERNGQKLPITIMREKIKTRSVKGFHRDSADTTKWHFMIDAKHSIAYVRLLQFTPHVADELAAALKSIGADKGSVKGLVLDLRNNPGGVLEDAIEIADLFLKEGVIVSTKGRAYPESIARAQVPGTLPDFPIALLINGNSASASEVLAGALVENNRAIALGTRSYGKGSVQSIRQIDVPDENGKVKKGELKITEQGYYLPSGRSISRKNDSVTWGIDPTPGFFVPITDQQLIESLKVRRDEDIMLRAPGKPGEAAAPTVDWTSTDSVLDALKDPQLSAAVHAVQTKIESGNWTPTGQNAPSVNAAAIDELQKLRLAHDRLMRDIIRIERRQDALDKGVGDEAPKAKDLWPDSVDVTGGKIRVYDKDGKLICTLDIESNSVERWLLDAEVKKVEEAPPPKPADPVK